MEKQNTIYSYEIQDIVGKSPSWLTKWGITIMIFIIILMLTISSFIHYPEKVRGKLIVYSTERPTEITSVRSGKLTVLINDGSFVNRGQPLAYLESGTNHAEVLKLKGKLQDMLRSYKTIYNKRFKFFFDIAQYQQLGELQEYYEKFCQSYIDYASESSKNSFHHKVDHLSQQNFNLKISEIRFRHETYSLLNIISDWISKNVIIANSNGKIIYHGKINKNQYIMRNETLFSISPLTPVFYGEIQIQQDDIAKVMVGQKAVIKVRGLPLEQFGKLEGKLVRISDCLWKDSLYNGEISLKQNLISKSMYHKLRSGMQADAEIITKQSSILGRILKNFTSSINM